MKRSGLKMMVTLLAGAALVGSIAAEQVVFAEDLFAYSLRATSLEDTDYYHFDRPLDWEPGLDNDSTFAPVVERMLDTGVDVCMSALQYGSVGSTGKVDTMLEYAEGTALKVCGWIPGYVFDGITTQAAYNDFADWLYALYSNQMTNSGYYKCEGRPVLFMWNPFDDSLGEPTGPFLPSDLRAVWTALSQRHGLSQTNFYTVVMSVHCSREKTFEHWSNDYIEDVLTAADNIYNWAPGQVNSAYAEELNLDFYEKMMGAKNNGSFNIASIRPMYFRRTSGGYYPADGTAFIREVWTDITERATNASPEWVVLSTWDDYSENSCFEPSLYNQGLYAAIARTMMDDWKGTTVFGDEAERWLTVPVALQKGEKYVAELIELNNPTTALPSVEIRMAENGSLVATVPSTPTSTLANGRIKVYRVEFEARPGLYQCKALYPRLFVNGAYVFGRPTRLYEQHQHNPLYHSFRIDDIALDGTVALSSTYNSGNDTFTYAVSGTASAGKLYSSVVVYSANNEILGEVEWENGVASFSESIDVPAGSMHDPLGMAYAQVHFKDSDGMRYAKVRVLQEAKQTARTTLYDLTGQDYFADPALSANTSEREDIIGHWLLDSAQNTYVFTNRNAEYKAVTDSGSWGTPLFFGVGPVIKSMSNSEDFYPEWDAVENAYSFDGADDFMRVPSHVDPRGSLYLGIVAKPRNGVSINSGSYLYYTLGGCIELQLISSETNSHIANVKFSRGVDKTTGELISVETQTCPIQEAADQFYIVEARSDGTSLVLRVSDENATVLEQVSYNFGSNDRDWRPWHDNWNDRNFVGGERYGETNEYFNGHIAEVLLGTAGDTW